MIKTILCKEISENFFNRIIKTRFLKIKLEDFKIEIQHKVIAIYDKNDKFLRSQHFKEDQIDTIYKIINKEKVLWIETSYKEVTLKIVKKEGIKTLFKQNIKEGMINESNYRYRIIKSLH